MYLDHSMETDVRTSDWLSTVPNPIINALLFGFARGDQEVSEALQETKASLFVRTAENQFFRCIRFFFWCSKTSKSWFARQCF